MSPAAGDNKQRFSDFGLAFPSTQYCMSPGVFRTLDLTFLSTLYCMPSCGCQRVLGSLNDIISTPLSTCSTAQIMEKSPVWFHTEAPCQSDTFNEGLNGIQSPNCNIAADKTDKACSADNTVRWVITWMTFLFFSGPHGSLIPCGMRRGIR